MTSTPLLDILWLCVLLVAAVASAAQGRWIPVAGFVILGVVTVVQASRSSPWRK